MIEVEKTKLEGVLLIKPSFSGDYRGEYVETYNEAVYRGAGIDYKFIQDDCSYSMRGVLRGIHGDYETAKLIDCLKGRIYFVVVDCREGDTFGDWLAFTLTDKNHWQVLVPPGFGNAHLALTDEIIFHYKQSTYYHPESQFTYSWDDERFKIWWPIRNPILSLRDSGFKR
jgi:dTDP-4-dehydrorhamnose 3,5-epimerase